MRSHTFVSDTVKQKKKNISFFCYQRQKKVQKKQKRTYCGTESYTGHQISGQR